MKVLLFVCNCCSSFLIWDRETNQWQTYEQAPVFRSYTLPEPFVMLFEAEEIGFSLKKKKQSESLQEATDDDELELDPPNAWFLSSRRLQYALADRARDLGFRKVEVIDSDLGVSADERRRTATSASRHRVVT